MKRENFDIAAGIVERMDKLEKTIFNIQENIINKQSYAITASDENTMTALNIMHSHQLEKNSILLNSGEIATIVFAQDILEYYVNTLNLELEDLRKSFEDLQ